MYAQFNNDYDEEMLDKAMPNRLDKQISTLLARLQSPWTSDRTDNRMMGFMYKRQRKAPHKWVLYRCILNGNNLYYFSDATSKRPRGIISVSFISQKMVTTEAHLLEIKNPEVSNEELDQWYSALQKIITESLPAQEVTFRDNVLLELLPLLSQKTSQDVEKIILMIAELEHSGFVKGRAKKERTGNLEMWLDDEEEWVKYYFVLQNKCLYYYKTSKAPPKGVITLQYTTTAEEDDAPKGEPFCFRLRTPLSSFVLKAKHQVAMEEWLDAIEAMKTGKKKEKEKEKEKKEKWDGGDEGLLGDLEFTEINRLDDVNLEHNAGYFKKVTPTIAFLTAEGKKKVVKLQAGTSSIGRSESCTITIEDKQVSRSHAKIDVTEASAGTNILSDLGSGHGTRVNHQPITTRTVLKHGDSVSMGKTKLKFLVTKK